MIPMGIAMITSAHDWAHKDRVCDACGKLTELDGEPVEAVAVEESDVEAVVLRLAA